MAHSWMVCPSRGPGEPGRDHAEFPAVPVSAGAVSGDRVLRRKLFGKILLMGDNGIREEQVLQIPVPEDLETKIDPMSRRHLELLVDRVVDTPADLQFPSQTAYEVQPLLAQILILSAFSSCWTSPSARSISGVCATSPNGNRPSCRQRQRSRR